MNGKTKIVFKGWLELTEDEKRDFVKEMLGFNNLSPKEKEAVNKEYKKFHTAQ